MCLHELATKVVGSWKNYNMKCKKHIEENVDWKWHTWTNKNGNLAKMGVWHGNDFHQMSTSMNFLSFGTTFVEIVGYYAFLRFVVQSSMKYILDIKKRIK